MFEAIEEITEYFDGPRRGRSYFLGTPCEFKSQWSGIYGTSGESDVFEITLVSGTRKGETLLATAKFKRVGDLPAQGEWPALQVEWQRKQPLSE